VPDTNDVTTPLLVSPERNTPVVPISSVPTPRLVSPAVTTAVPTPLLSGEEQLRSEIIKINEKLDDKELTLEVFKNLVYKREEHMRLRQVVSVELLGPLRELVEDHPVSLYESHLHTGYDERDLSKSTENREFKEYQGIIKLCTQAWR
jgi:hypothetical protein